MVLKRVNNMEQIEKLLKINSLNGVINWKHNIIKFENGLYHFNEYVFSNIEYLIKFIRELNKKEI